MEFEQFILNDQVEMMETFMLALQEITSSKDHCRDDSIKLFSVMEDSFGDSQLILKMNCSQLLVMIRTLRCGDVTNLFGHQL